MRTERLKQLRLELDKTQREIAALLGIARTTYIGYEKGERSPDLEMVDKIAGVFKVSTDYLLGRTDVREPADIDPAEKHHPDPIEVEEFLRRLQSGQVRKEGLPLSEKKINKIKIFFEELLD